jgi:uncharacterized protein YndB with AHSA1/START domain
MKTILHVSDIGASSEEVFRALTSIEGLGAWWTIEVQGDPGPSGVIDFTFAGDFNPSMRVTGYDVPSSVAWICIGGVTQWADNTFRFALEDRDGMTRLRFRQEYATELSDDEYGSYNYNWGYYLESLRLYCEQGRGKPYAAGS